MLSLTYLRLIKLTYTYGLRPYLSLVKCTTYTCPQKTLTCHKTYKSY